MIVPEFKHLRKEQLKKRIKILNVLIYASAAIGIISFVVFFFTHYKYNWSWLLMGLTYILLSVNFVGMIRRMRKEIQKRGDRLSQKA
jgi:O-antigen/teichoic acid export membrane protein